MAPPTTPSTSQYTPQQPLRRATYVHVSDLISAYNIDHAQLEKEISRVNEKRTKLRAMSSTAAATGAGKDRIGTGRSDYRSDDSSDGVSAPEEDPDIEDTLGPIAPQKRLQPPRGGFNLCVLVGNINLVVDKRRVDQSRVRLAEVEIGDETGTVSLRARDQQIDLLEKVRSEGKPGAVVMRNCTLELYQGKHIRLAVTKWGKLTEYPDNVSSTPPPPSAMNSDRNFSLIDLSVVASEISEKEHTDSMAYANSTTTTTSGGRQGKKSSLETRTSGSSASSPMASSASSMQGKSGAKNQQQGSRRGNRSSTGEQRRQNRNPQYGGTKTDKSQPLRSDPMMYRGMQGYHAYGEQGGHMRQHYPPHAQYAHHPHTRAHSQPQQHQDVASVQFALHQQYEMQQRQLQQLYSREQNRAVGQVPQQPPPQQTSPMLVNVDPSFDGSEIGNSPVLVPNPEHYSQLPKMEGHSRMQQDAPQGMAHPATAGYPSLGVMSGYQIGKMNPEATSFAPTYLSAAQGSDSKQHMSYMPYPPQPSYYAMSQQQQQPPFLGGSVYSLPPSGHHPSLLVPSGVDATHHHMVAQQVTSFDAPMDQQQETGSGAATATATATTTSQSHRPRYQQHYVSHYPPAVPPAKESSSSKDKENVTSKPGS